MKPIYYLFHNEGFELDRHHEIVVVTQRSARCLQLFCSSCRGLQRGNFSLVSLSEKLSAVYS